MSWAVLISTAAGGICRGTQRLSHGLGKEQGKGWVRSSDLHTGARPASMGCWVCSRSAGGGG